MAISLRVLGACVALTAGVAGAVPSAQDRAAGTVARLEQMLADGIFAAEPVSGAPFSGTATLTWQPPGRGPKRRVMTRYFRDADGRVRVEQAFTDLRTGQAMRRTLLSPQPAHPDVVMIDADGTARAMPRGVAAGFAGSWTRLVLPLAPGCNAVAPLPEVWHTFATGEEPGKEPLGERMLDGLAITGTRVTARMPAGAFSDPAGLGMRGEQWVSPDLRALVYAKVEDAQIGVVEYQLAHISRTPPAPSSFVVPAAVEAWPSAGLPRLSSFRLTGAGPLVREGGCAGLP